MGEQLRISGVVPESIVDGRGFRFTIFTQGCPHHCPGCHNPQTHDFSGGKLVDTDWLFQELKKDPLLKGVTFSGGGPFCQPGILARLAQRIHQETKLDVTVYTGWTLEELWGMQDPDIAALLNETDVLIDGRYVEAERDLSLLFRGSRNQRVIDMKASRAAGAPVLLQLDEPSA